MFSLTPGFSRVLRQRQDRNRFNGFIPGKTVETVCYFSSHMFTPLKQGVNEIRQAVQFLSLISFAFGFSLSSRQFEIANRHSEIVNSNHGLQKRQAACWW